MPEPEIQDDSLPELSRSTSGQPSSQKHVKILSLPKNRSTGNLIAYPVKPSELRKNRVSFDTSPSAELDSTGRSPIVPELEHGLASSGLRRIRQQPPSWTPTQPPSPEASFISLQRSSSMSLALPSSQAFTPNGPLSPTLNFSEDLSRFPSESLHSFSFANQSDDLLHNRPNVLKRSLDFMRDKLGWAADNPGILSAQAKVSGDMESQKMMELFKQANVLRVDGYDTQKHPASNGPLTGPASMDGGNIFAKAFMPRSEDPSPSDEETQEKLDVMSVSGDSQSPVDNVPENHPMEPESETNDFSAPHPDAAAAERTYLRRTLTDTRSLSLQNRLMDILSQPYAAVKDGQKDRIPLSLPASAFDQPASTSASSYSTVHGHGHANRWAPAAQAIFTTESHPPWTILAANDLACLVFGVTKAEVRKIGILEVVREDRRDWLEDKLRAPGSDNTASPRAPQGKVPRSSPRQPSASAAINGGVTAQLLSKPPSHQKSIQRAQTDDGFGSSYRRNAKALNHTAKKSRGVLLCGDVVPIQKRNGATGSASLWVKEKRGGLIWVLEEVSEDVIEMQIDEEGHVTATTGPMEPIWGTGEFQKGTRVQELIPNLPVIEHARTPDYARIHELKNFTLRNEGGIHIPVCITLKENGRDLRVASFPHIAGMLVLSADTLKVISSNSVFSAALFGQPNPNGLEITGLIPRFDGVLEMLTEQEDNAVKLVDGVVIPEHSFRRARALLAFRDGLPNAASILLYPNGLTACHRDGSDINVDVQMRVVKSETFRPSHSITEEDVEDEGSGNPQSSHKTSELVYALWITYSRYVHSKDHLAFAGTPELSRPSTPPNQPSPSRNSLLNSPQPVDMDVVEIVSPSAELISQQLEEAASQPISDEPIQHPAPDAEPISSSAKSKDPPKKKSISDFVILEEMGQGAYGQVKLARYRKNNAKKVVIKYVTKRRILVDTWTRDRRLGTIPLEIHILDYLRRDALKHPNIIEMTDFFEDDINYYIETLPHGLPGLDLFDYIEMRPTMEECECRNIFRQVVSALHHLHTKALVVHRDIKDENIVLDGENKVKLIDFGSAAYIKNGPFDVFVGTIDYAAPEVLQGNPYRGKEQDVWALGILLYTIVYKENPFYSIDEIMDHELRIPWIMSEKSIDLIKAMLNRDVDQRLTITQVVEHPWCQTEDGV